MTSLTKPIERRTLQPYRHYRKRIVVKLFADSISLRLERTRTAYEVPIATLMDVLCRWEAQRIQRERKARRKAAKR